MSRRWVLEQGKEGIEEPTINLTPLIDVVFVILIMFIVIAPLLEMDEIALADAPTQRKQGGMNVQETSPIVLYVKKDNTIWMDQKPVALGQLELLLENKHKQYPHAKPQLFHDREAQFGTYQTIKNALEGAGFEQIEVILKP